MRGGLRAWLSPVPLDLNSFLLKGRTEEREKSPTILPSQKPKSQTTNTTSSDPTFQMGLSPDSFKLLLVCLHLNSLHTSWICSPLLSNSSHMKPAPQVTRCLLIPNQAASFRGFTSLALKRPLLPWVSTISPPLILAVHYMFSVLPFSLWFLSEYQGFPKLLILAPKILPSLLAILSICRDFSYLLSEEYIGSMLIPGLFLKEQTLTSNELLYISTKLQDNWTKSGREGTGNQLD